MKLFSRLIGAFVLGVGAIFGHNTDREAHWSDPPNWIADAETGDADTGDP